MSIYPCVQIYRFINHDTYTSFYLYRIMVIVHQYSGTAKKTRIFNLVS